MATAVSSNSPKNFALSGLYEDNPPSFEVSRAQNTRTQARIIGFNKKLEEILAIKDTEEKSRALQKFAFEEHTPQTLDKTELMKLFVAFRDNNGPHQMQ